MILEVYDYYSMKTGGEALSDMSTKTYNKDEHKKTGVVFLTLMPTSVSVKSGPVLDIGITD